MLRHCLILSLALCAVLYGCAAREYAAPTALVPEEAPALSFEERVAALPEGSAQYFAESPFGPAAIDASTFYISGLSNECRTVRIATRKHKPQIRALKGEKQSMALNPKQL